MYQSYGYEHLATFDALVRVGLLLSSPVAATSLSTPVAPPLSFSTLSRLLRLEVPDVDEADPNDIAYVYAGFAPITVRIVEYLMRALEREATSGAGSGGIWKGLEEAMRQLPGPTIDVCLFVGSFIASQKYVHLHPSPYQEIQRPPPGIDWTPSASTTLPKRTSVLFIGGVCSAEISALRFLGERSDISREFLVLTTGMVTGREIINDLVFAASGSNVLTGR